MIKAFGKKAGLFAAATALLLVAFTAFAQRADGNINGDASPGDKVYVANTGTGLKRETVADEDGKYRFRSLPLGTYEVKIVRGEENVLNATVTLRPGGTARPPTPKAGDAATGADPAPSPAPSAGN
ncbi:MULTISPECIES: carboxypeptidase-like regulatory domain-containing protein [unclassified Pseudoxanthomonas]|jgi:hypothetical protein|uniref:carboxypeptidase-like regulatory domain-containing protein n=1 Tax=unclassified Pseudoxanthomonas TaxID=2645906 RepID=UPI001617B45D|nr:MULTISPECIES: carboxypeptidase-like regulatory domain-containing protein [unclassified Pseudoxanthomonas]MBB3277472.1 hypothetical protein [Pseudoxanthomonas sp. OG2]MBD9376336.1 carboxypeptidase regulatory-like domain-containing protein [Pseudoxanthomonas sp. PXM04]MBV7474144.1 carboxypeptidase-like regulatory domain-containing protein [Pseudoxanthomonas sp. PXM05]UBB26283.1 carboxypeptidase-like regulatory domain-containing protein [Pseudoxanthomonas japonensis]